ncbi:MAG TPA: hypothetical protein QF764_03675 [Planctomycetota bacterium]|jgi:hypothetical protein|nr:hypothetical protein [Planctomycetota bacterium]
MKTLLAALLVLGLCSLTPAPRVDSPSRAPRSDSEIEVSIMRLTSIQWRPGARLPDWVRALDGQRVKVVGYMALDTHEGARSFRQTWDQCGCESAKASHFIEVGLGEKTTGYNPDQITVIGTMSVGEQKEDGFVTSLFRLAAESVN